MIKRKKKVCRHCKLPKFIFGSGLCNFCYNRRAYHKAKAKPKSVVKKNKPLRKISKKKKTELEIYSKKRAEFLKLHPICEGRFPGCHSNNMLTIHHLKGREGKNMLDDENWMTLCMPCHRFVHDNPKWSYENGFLKSKHAKEQ